MDGAERGVVDHDPIEAMRELQPAGLQCRPPCCVTTGRAWVPFLQTAKEKKLILMAMFAPLLVAFSFLQERLCVCRFNRFRLCNPWYGGCGRNRSIPWVIFFFVQGALNMSILALVKGPWGLIAWIIWSMEWMVGSVWTRYEGEEVYVNENRMMAWWLFDWLTDLEGPFWGHWRGGIGAIGGVRECSCGEVGDGMWCCRVVVLVGVDEICCILGSIG